MGQNEQPLPQLALPRTNPVGARAFDDDKLGRKALGERLTGYVERLREGAVLAIDAPWGEGKTWFGKNWQKHLESHGHRVIFIDAFEQDYIEDPFLLIAAEISRIAKVDKGAVKELRAKAASVMKTILPVSTKTLINIAGRVALGATDLSGDLKGIAETASEGAADVTEKWAEEKIDELTQEKESLKNFRIELAKFAAAQEKPIVLFIDELDRCRPSFAVRLIERLKHFFDVPNLVFVLLLNRDQLEKAVKGVYGRDTDAAAYLGKFVNFFLHLPKQTSLRTSDHRYSREYIDHIYKQYKFSDEAENNSFKNILYYLAIAHELSPRDIEKAVAMYAFAQPVEFGSFFMAYLIMIKIKHPNLFTRLINSDKSAHIEARKILEASSDRMKSHNFGIPVSCGLIGEIHEAYISGFDNISADLKGFLQHLWHYNLPHEALLTFWASRIDLPLEG